MIRFDIQAGAEYLLGWAKRKLYELKAHREGLGVASLQKTFSMPTGETVYVRASSLNDLIRIRGGGGYLVNVLMPDPTPYRSLFLGELFSTQLQAILSDGTVLGSLAQTLYSGTDYTPIWGGSWSGGEFADTYHVGTYSYNSTLNFPINVPEDVYPYPAISGPPGTPSLYMTAEVVVSGTGVNYTYTQTNTMKAGSTVYTTTSGTTVSAGSDADNRTITYSNYATGSGFSGNFVNGVQTISGGVTVSDTTTATPIMSTSFYLDALAVYEATYSADAGRYAAAWEAGHVIGLARNKARLLTNHDNVIDILSVAHELPELGADSWADKIKRNALISTKPRVLLPVTATLNSAVIPDYSFLGTEGTGYDVTVTRNMTVRYTDANGNVVSTILEGTWRQQETLHTFIPGGAGGSYQNTFTNFPAFDPDNGSFIAAMKVLYGYNISDIGPQRDAVGTNPIGVILNGSLTSSYLVADSTYGAPSDPYGLGIPSPALPVTTSSVTATVAQPYLDFLGQVSVVSVDTLRSPQPAYTSNWMSTSMVSGDIVSVIPYGPVLDDEDLGMFGDHTGAQKIAIYGVAQFRYNLNGSFTFVGWRDGIPATETEDAGPKIVSMTDSTGVIAWPNANCVIKYAALEWADIKATAAAQAAAINNPSNSENRFLRLVKTTIGI